MEAPLAELWMRGRDHAPGLPGRPPERRPWRTARPGPHVAEPERRQHVEGGWRRPPVPDGDLDEDVLGAGLGVFHEHVEVAILIEDARIQQLVLELLAAPAPVGLYQVAVWIGRLRVLVQILHVRMRGRG